MPTADRAGSHPARISCLPTLSVERTILDLIELGTDISLVADALRDAVRQGKVTWTDNGADDVEIADYH